MNFFLKTIIFLVIFSLIFNSSGFLRFTPNKAEAGWWSTIFNQIADYALKTWEWVQNNWQKMMRDIIAKRIIDYIVDQTVVWIQGGGKPQFITNWDGFLKDAEAIAIDSVVNEIGLGFICSPFKLNVQLSLLPVPKFSRRITCTLENIVKNIEDFYEDFGKGGWIAYNEAWQPQNNYFGMILIAQDEIMARSAAKVSASQNEAQSSGGFLGVKQCVSRDDDSKKKYEECRAVIKWGSAQDQMDFCAEKAKTAPCSKEEIVTPGTAVGQAVGSAITSDKEWAANITSWTSALFNALINKYAKEGLSKLKKSEPNKPPDYYPPEYQNLRANYYEQDKERMINEIRRAANNSIGVDTSVITQETLIYASSTLAMLQEMQSFGCFVDANEIAAAQNETDNLLFQSNAGGEEADLLINDIRATNPSDSFAWSSVLERYSAFMNRDKQNLDNIQNNNTNYDPLADAQNKLTAAINQNNAISIRLASCKSPIVINDGADTTTGFNVFLKLNAASPSISGINNITQMMVSNDPAFLNAAWEIYSTTKFWTLTAGVGLKTVYIKFSNAANIISNTFSDDITLQ